MASFFDKNNGMISGRVRAINNFCRDIEPTLDFSKPDYLNVEIMRAEAHKRGLTLHKSRAAKLLCRIKQKQAGWTITNSKETATA